jgi:hypothetical protein
MRGILKSLLRVLGDFSWLDLPQMASQLLNDPLKAVGFGLIVLCTFGWVAYQQYQEALQSRQLDRIEDYLRRLDQAHFVVLRDAANKLFIDSQSGRIDFGQLTEQERNNPHIILFKLLTERIDHSEERLEKILNNLPEEIRGQLRLLLLEISDEMHRQLAELNQQLSEEIRQAKAELADEVASYFQRFEALFRGENRPPLYVPLLTDERQRLQARYLPISRWVPLIGRIQEFQHLCAFLEGEARLRWHLLIGSGGQGKSRLALELILHAHQKGWDAGFFQRNTPYTNWHCWTPEHDTLIVFDYASLQAETIRNALLALQQKTQQDGCPRVRVLLLERYFDERASWFETLIAKGSSERVIIESCYYQPPHAVAGELELSAPAEVGVQSDEMLPSLSTHFTKVGEQLTFPTIQPYRLQPLQEEDFLHLMYEYYSQYCSYQNLSGGIEKWDALRPALTRLPEGDYRPLFAAFAGEAIAANGIDAVRHWNAQQLVKWVLDRDYAQWRERKIDQKHANLVAFATVVGGLSSLEAAELGKNHSQLFPDFDREFSEEHYKVLTAYTPRESEDSLVGIQPDLLGELFILERLGNNYQLGAGYRRAQGDTEQIIRLAWQHTRQTEGEEQRPITAFIIRCAADFSDHPALESLLKLEPQRGELLPLYQDTLAEAIAWLTTEGSQELFQEMLQKLPPDKKAGTLFKRGMAYLLQGNWEKAMAGYSAVIEMPDAPAMLKAQAQLYLGLLYFTKGDITNAVAEWWAMFEIPANEIPAKMKAIIEQLARSVPIRKELKEDGDG